MSLDPQWADPIKNRVRQVNQARAVNEVVNALKPFHDGAADGGMPGLSVVNGLSAATSSPITTAARENVRITPVDGLPGRLGTSTIKWGGVLMSHAEAGESSDLAAECCDVPVSAKRLITPSLETLEKAASARIYFENLYFPLLRQPPSREQRRAAMERDMLDMRLNEQQKEYLRTRWQQNETEYLREQRRKVDASAFIKLKTIGHGSYVPSRLCMSVAVQCLS